MSITIEDLKPYTSLQIARIREDIEDAPSIVEMLSEISTDLKEVKGPGKREAFKLGPVATGPLQVGSLHYRERRPPPWLLPEATLRDTLHHLVLACRLNDHFAIFTSDPTAKGIIARRINSLIDSAGLGGLEFVPPDLLNAAFLKDGPTRTLWLSGIHRRTKSKADSKILAGLGLRDALDPLADQTYRFSAARVVAENLNNLAVGVTPTRSRIWAGSVRTWPEFRDRVQALLERVESVKQPEAKPMPILAYPESNPQNVHGAYDLSVIAPELLHDDPNADVETGEQAERWGHHARFAVTGTDGPGFSAVVTLDGEELGTIAFDVQMKDGSRAEWTLAWEGDVEETEDHKEARKVLKRPGWVTVRYDSGHTLSDGRFWSVRHRDVRFTDWEFVKLESFDVKKEKPTKKNEEGKNVFEPALIGKQDSLFCWMRQHWPSSKEFGDNKGWLASDDGSGEIADFIHISPDEAGGPLVTLIHVKGSGSDKQNRGISTSDYEVVVGQAVKNLRSLDRSNLAERLKKGEGKTIAAAVWKDGNKQKNRAGLIKAVKKLGAKYRRRVVVLQPRVRQSVLKDIWKNQDQGLKHPQLARIQQLDTLLVGAAADCRALGAKFFVIGEDDT